MNYPKVTLDLVPPKVNLNGTSKETLLANYIGVLRALTALDTAMSLATPHGRDYQTLSDANASVKAREAWMERRLLVEELRKDVEHCAEIVAAGS